MKTRWMVVSLFFLITVASGPAQARTWDNGAKTGRWSNPTNWAPDGVPLAGEAVVFDATSLSNCTADTVSNGLGSLTFASAYTGTVTFLTNAVETGMVLTVTGDVVLNAGHLVFTGDPNAVGDGATNRKFGVGYTLAAANLSIAAAASLNADGLGFPKNQGPGRGVGQAGTGNFGGAGHGGQGGNGRLYGNGGLYGAAQGPTSLGSGAGHVNGGPGGGAIKLVVPGTITVNGRLSANGGTGTAQYGFGGSGGSIWIAGGTLQGGGLIAANGGTNTTAGVRGSGAGRIDLSEAVNNFSGAFEVLCATNNGTAGSVRGLAGSLLLPQSAGTGLTRDAMVVTNTLYFGYGQSFGSVLVTNGGCLVLDANSNDYVYVFDTLVVATNSSVLCPGNREDVNAEAGGTTNIPYGRGVVISARVARINSGGAIQADGRGFANTDGPGAGSTENSGNYNGGSHGGRGGENFFGGGLTYGSATGCVSLGSGASHASGGAGGGAIKLIVGETLTVNGRLSANGLPGSSYGAGGAGGSIWIASGTVEGDGIITARGFRGGGGGRIDMGGTTNNFTGPLEVLSDDGATYGFRGLAGSLMLPRSAGTGLILDNFVPVRTNVVFGNSVVFGNVTLTNGVMLSLEANTDSALFTFSSLTVESNATLECRGNYYDINAEAGGSPGNLYGAGPVMMAATVTVARGGRITAEGLGFPRGTGPGRGMPGVNYVAGGYGGKGALFDTVYGLTYGSETRPTALGSGGGHTSAGQGGGAISLLVTNTLTVEGTITSKGGNGSGAGGGGAGGSLRIEADTLSGTGTLSVAGGTGSGSAGGGGGGRMSLRYRVKTFTGPYTAAGGTGSTAGGTGTIYEVNTSLANTAPAAPTLLTPTNGGAVQGQFQMRTLDADLDYLQFKVEIAEDAGFASIVRTVDQTASQSNWFGQTEMSRTAYAPSGTATLVIAPPLAVNSSYYWRVSALDPGGSATWGPLSAVQSFTTPADVLNTWTATGGLWSAAANWSNRRAPQPGESVLFSAALNTGCTIDSISNGLVNFVMETGMTRTVTFLKNAVQGGGMHLQLTGDLTVNGGTLVFGADPTKMGDGPAGVPYGAGYTVTVANVTVGPGASINSDNQGFAANAGPGKSPDNTRDWGGSYGGRGGVYSFTRPFPVAPCYGRAAGPTALGSGGSGNPGGGAIKLIVSGVTTVNGTLSASAQYAAQNSSMGSGGSLWLTGGTLQGTGLIAVNSGHGMNVTCGGGGGRIDISGVANNFSGTLDARNVAVWGGSGLNGSILLPQSSGSELTMDHFVLTNTMVFGNSQTFTNPVVIAGGGRLTLVANTNENVFTFTSLTIASNASVVCQGNWAVENAAAGGATNRPYGMGITLIASNVTIDAGGSLNANGAGGSYGFGPGYGTNLAAAGHGGLAAKGFGATYGAISNVTELGSGGRTGYGGGALRMIVAGTLTVNGTNSSDGAVATWNGPAGAGGSLWIDCDRLEGSGLISAKGGAAGNDDGGGGGRIHLIYNSLGLTNPVTAGKINAYGGTGGSLIQKGAAGTVLLTDRTSSDKIGTLIIANDLICSNTVTLLPRNTDGYAGSPLTLTVDKLVLREQGILQVPSNRAIAVVSLFSNGVAFAASTNRSLLSFVAETNSVFAFVGTNDAAVYGSNVFEVLQINAGNKIVRFEAGRTNRVQRGLVLDQAQLRSTQDGVWWYLNGTATATQNVKRVYVRDSNAEGGALIVAGRGSSNGGHNVNWQFPGAGGVLIQIR